MANEITSRAKNELDRLEWMISDAKKRVVKAAEQMKWRAEQAVKDATAMANEDPCSLIWVEFAEGDLHEAKEAKAELTKLYDKQSMIQHLIG